MIIYCGKSENILKRNLMILIFSVDIIAVSRIWSILHIAIVMPMRQLEACTQKMKDYDWGFISMGKLLDKIKDNLNMIVYQPEFIHDKSVMKGTMDPWAAELPTVQQYLDQKLKQQKTNYFNSTSTTKALPPKDLRKQMFSHTNQDNKDTAKILEDLGVMAATRWVQELLDPKKATYILMSESGAE